MLKLFHFCLLREKGGALTQSYDKSHTTYRNFKRSKWQHKQRHKNYQKCIKQNIFTLEKEITDIEDSPSDTIDMVKKKDIEKELSALCNDKFRGAQIRSRAKWIEEGEKNSKYFFKSGS